MLVGIAPYYDDDMDMLSKISKKESSSFQDIYQKKLKNVVKNY